MTATRITLAVLLLASLASAQATQPSADALPPQPDQSFHPLPASIPRHLVFIIDAPRSAEQIDWLRDELAKSVGNLRPTHSFNVIFMQDNSYLALSEKNLLLSTPEHKQEALEFIKKFVPRNVTDPLPAIKLAFAMNPRPHLIFLLTDGDFPDNKAVVDCIDRENPDRKVKVNTIGYGHRDDENEKVLKEIASRNGGLYKYVPATMPSTMPSR